MKLSKEVKVGLLAVTSCVVFYIGFNFLKGIDFFSPTHTYYAVYKNIDGLEISNPVLLNGLTVGRVGDIEILSERGHAILVSLDVDNNLVLGKKSAAILINSDLLGSKAIVLDIGNITETLSPGDTISAKVDMGITETLQKSAIPILDNLWEVTNNINKILDSLGNGGAKINEILDHFLVTSQALQAISVNNQKNIYAITSNFNALSAALNDTTDGIIPLLAKLNTTADSLNQMELNETLYNANLAMTNLNQAIQNLNEGQGSLGKLLHDDSLYTNLNLAAKDLDHLLIDLKEHPGRYVHFSLFGKKEKKKSYRK